MASEYTCGKAAEICARIAEGRSLRSICKDADMPVMSTVFKWLTEQPDFSEQYVRAREAQADALAEETLDIADDGQNDWMASNDPDNPGYKLNGEHVQRSRLRCDARRWFASKVAPKKYGDKVQQVVSGPDGGPIQTEDVSARDILAGRVAGISSRIGTPVGNSKPH